MSDVRPDPRLAYAIALLQDCVRDGAPAFAENASPWSEPDAWPQSSTDILIPWYPTAGSRREWTPVDLVSHPRMSGPLPPPAAWDGYFAGASPSFSGAAGVQRVSSVADSVHTPAGAAAIAAAGDAALPDPVATEAVSETLYAFLHAIGRGDVDAAMEEVAPDYHAMEGDREVTRDVLRQQIEAVVDARRDRALDVSLAQIPEPIAHKLGMLVKVAIQIDSRREDGGLESLVLHRVAVFRTYGEQSAHGRNVRRTAPGHVDPGDSRWMLAALSIVDPPA